MSKYLIFEKEVNPTIFKGDKVRVISKGKQSFLGEITYYPTWSQYVFEPISNALFNDECLMDIVKEINKLNDAFKGVPK